MQRLGYSDSAPSKPNGESASPKPSSSQSATAAEQLKDAAEPKASTESEGDKIFAEKGNKQSSSSSSESSSLSTTSQSAASRPAVHEPDWEDRVKYSIQTFSELPHSNFGINQHVPIDQAFKEALRMIPWQFKAPIMYAAAYGSGVFPQQPHGTAMATEEQIRAVHPKPPQAVVDAQNGNPKMIDFIFGVTHTQHWHSLNLAQHRDHYSAVGSLGSGFVSWLQDSLGAGVYFHPYVPVNGILVKYGVVNLTTLCRDLSEWDTLYLAGRLHKPVKILRDNPNVRLANQSNLLSALRTAMLLLPPRFSETDLYSTIAGLSYLGDPRMTLPAEDPGKVNNIVTHNFVNFRRLYAPLIATLPNIRWDDASARRTRRPGWETRQPIEPLGLEQDMDLTRRGNMVRRLPRAFRARLYTEYRDILRVDPFEFANLIREDAEAEAEGKVVRKVGGDFDRGIAGDDPARLRATVRKVVRDTVKRPATVQAIKGVVTAGVARSWRYLSEKWQKGRGGRQKQKEEGENPKETAEEKTEVSAAEQKKND